MGSRTVLVLVALAGTAAAQTPKKTFDFSGDALQGQLVRPDGELITVTPARVHFDPAKSPARIAELERALAGRTPDAGARGDQFMELAGLLNGQHRYWRLQTIEREVARDQLKDPARRQAIDQQVVRDRAEAQRAFDRAVAVYTEVICDRADRARGFDCVPPAALARWPQMADALFELADLLQGMRRGPDALKLYARLTLSHPQSPWAPYGLLAAAERAFEDGRLPEAEKLYAQVLASKATDLHGYARYKTGWVQLNLSRDADAFASFAAVITAGARNPRGEALAREARRDIVRAYASFGKPAEAAAAFDRVAPGHAMEMLPILADPWSEQGRSDNAIAAYSELERRAPADKRVCEWAQGLVRNTLITGNAEDKVAALQKLLQVYRRLKGTRGFPAEQLRECADESAQITGELARVWHQEASKGAPGQLEVADRMYRLYLANFPGAADAGKMRFYWAELAWTRAEREKNPATSTRLWEEAAARETEAAHGAGIDDKTRKEAAYAAVLAWKNALRLDARPAPPPRVGDDMDPKPEPIPGREQKLITVMREYIALVKDAKDDELPAMKFLVAKIYWRYEHFDEAVALFERILTEHLDNEVAEYSANLLIDSLNRQKKYPAMLAWVDRLLAQTAFVDAHPDLKEMLTRLKQQGVRKAAEKLEQQRDYAGCGQAYLDIANRDPAMDRVEEVLYNAAVCFELAGQAGAALSLYNQLADKYPTTQVGMRALLRVAHLQERLAHVVEAAAMYERYARRFGGEKDAVSAQSQAIFLYRSGGDLPRAIAATEFFIKQYGRVIGHMAEIEEAAFTLARLYDDAGDKARAAAALDRYLVQFGNRSLERTVAAHIQRGTYDWERSCKVHPVDGACVTVRRQKIAPAGKPALQCRAPVTLLVPVARDAALAASARAHFQAALDLAGRRPELYPAAVAADWYLGEAEFEAFLAVGFPAGLAFDPRHKAEREQSSRRFTEYLGKKTAMIRALTDADTGSYSRIIKSGARTDWAAAAALRTGQLSASLAAALVGADLPPETRKGPYAAVAAKAYCD
ncbi:MAG TPA: tetratricopeptide repeat protein, partial [Kofleriaceae bacterium]|nr:tetratricopeptide repeat protein [Kofleriaceae bacterium]